MDRPMKSHDCRSFAWLEHWRVRRHFAGTISPAGERRMRAHLSNCAGCRAYYETQLSLSEVDPHGKAAFERIGRGLGLVGAEQGRGHLPLLAMAAAAAALLLVVGSGRF